VKSGGTGALGCSTLFPSPIASPAYFPLSTFYFSLSTGEAIHCRAFGLGEAGFASYLDKRSLSPDFRHGAEGVS
jgi:hypothetical protein